MKHKLSLFLLLVLHLHLFSQNSFFNNYKQISHERSFSSVQLDDGGYLLVGEKRVSGYYGINQAYITKVSQTSEIVNEVLMNPAEVSRFCIITPYQYGNTDFLCIGSTDSVSGSNTFSRIVFYGIDAALNITYQKHFTYKKDYFQVPWQFDMPNDSILYLMVDNMNNQNSSRNVVVTKYKMPSDSLASYTINNLSISQDLNFIKVKQQLDVFVYPNNKLLQFDKDLNLRTSKQYPEKFPSSICITPLSDTNYLLTGSAFNNISYNLQVGCLRNNNDDITEDSLFYTPSIDTNFYAGGRENTAKNGNSIFIAGFYNVAAYLFPYNFNPSWVTITKTDLDLNMVSTHFYGGDAQYCPYSIIPTLDGGCFVTGYSYDYINNLPNGNYELDIFALKVNSDGLITELPNQPQAKAHDALLYPNPGSEILNIQSGPQINGAQFTMYDMQGRAMRTETITATTLKLTTSTLPSGTYPWQIVFKNKVIESGKWVKE